MIKRIQDMTDTDKAKFFRSVQVAYARDFNTPWDIVSQRIQDDIDAAFDDERFEKMKIDNPEFAIDAENARKYFKWDKKHKKPSMIDYILWSVQFVTKSDGLR